MARSYIYIYPTGQGCIRSAGRSVVLGGSVRPVSGRAVGKPSAFGSIGRGSGAVVPVLGSWALGSAVQALLGLGHHQQKARRACPVNEQRRSFAPDTSRLRTRPGTCPADPPLPEGTAPQAIPLSRCGRRISTRAVHIRNRVGCCAQPFGPWPRIRLMGYTTGRVSSFTSCSAPPTRPPACTIPALGSTRDPMV